MATVNIILLKIKRLKDGRHPVVLRFTQRRRRHYITTGYACFEHDWNQQTNLFHTTIENHEKKNLVVRGWLEQAKRIINEYGYRGEELNFDLFRQEFRKAIFKRATISNYFHEAISQYRENGQLSNAGIYKNTHQFLMRFTRGHDLLFDDVNKTFLNDFNSFLSEQVNRKGEKISGFTIQAYFRTIRALFNRAIDEGLVAQDVYPFANKLNPGGFEILKPTLRIKKKALSKEQVAQIIEFNAIPGTSFFHTKSYFVFSYLAGGMDFQDLALFTWRNVHGERFHYTRARTGKTYSIRINKEMKRIMDYYWNHKAKYVFPILADDIDDTARQVTRIRSARKQFNKNITEIARSLGINMQITSGMIRHTFASVLYREGAPLPEISMALKHNNVLETRAYLQDIELQVRDRLQDMLL